MIIQGSRPFQLHRALAVALEGLWDLIMHVALAGGTVRAPCASSEPEAGAEGRNKDRPD